eukprot:TRINITY_DN760_c2_g2_i2.p2 TRINITY_DN760_c2_g2~~TRINITY_DN760_c2_g2_i2.p2  ORF type:complete len:1280 (+),score=504.50 TRINITY_DN760_c2_g2_i2:6407-10246(+)
MLAAQLVQQLGGARGLGIGHAGHRLIQQQQLRLLHQQHADLQPLLLAVREQTGHPMFLAVQTDQLEDVLDLADLLGRQARKQRGLDALVHLHGQFQVLEHGVLLEHGRALELAADAGVRDLILGHPGQVDGLAEEGGTGGGPGLAGDDIHHRGLARAIGTDQAGDGRPRHGEAELADRPHAAEHHRQALHRQAATGALRQGGVTFLCIRRYRRRQLRYRPAPARHQSRQQAGHAIRCDPQHQQEQGTEEQQAIVFQTGQQFRQGTHDHGADQRPQDGTGAAQHHHQDEEDGLHEAEGVRRHQPRQRCEQAAGQSCQRRRDGEGDGLDHQRIDADRLGGGLAIAHRAHGGPPATTRQPAITGQHHGHARQGQDGDRTLALQSRHGGRHQPHDAVLAAGDVAPFDDGVLDDEAEGNRDHGQVRPLHAQGRQGQQQAQGARHHGRQRPGQPERQTGPGGENGHRIGAHGVETDMPEGDLPGQADQHIEADADDGHQRNAGQHEDVVAVHRQGQGGCGDQTQYAHAQCRGRPQAQPDGAARCRHRSGASLQRAGNGMRKTFHTLFTCARPNRPLGRIASTTITSPKLIIWVQPEPSVAVTSDSAMPNSRPAIITPQALVMPPRMATAKAFRPNSVPMSALTLNSGAMSTPATPASTVEMAKAAAMARVIGMPIRRAASRFCTTASNALPQRVRRRTVCSSAARTRPMTGISNCSGYTPSPTPPSSIDDSASGEGRLRGSLPKVCRTRLSSTMPSATVDISQALEPWRANGRTASTSTSTPQSAQAASASSTASHIGQPSVWAKVKHRTAPSIMELPCAKLTVPETAYVMVKPSAIRPYMLPSPNPLISADNSSIVFSWRRHSGRRTSCVDEVLLGQADRQDAVVDELRPDVVVGLQGVMHARAEGLDVALDQAVIAIDLVEALADGIALGGAGLGDGQRGQLHAVVGIGHTDGRRDVVRSLDGGILGLEFSHHLLAHWRELAEEAEGLDEVDVLRVRSGQLGEAATGRAPVRDHRHLPAHAVERLDHLRRGTDIAHQVEGVGASGLEAAQLRHQVDIAGLELFHAHRFLALLGQCRGDALLIGFAPGIVDQDQAGLAALEGLLGVVQHGLVHQFIHGRDTEGEIGIGTIPGHAGAGRPGPDERHLLLVDDGHDSHRHRRIEAAEEHRYLFLEDQFARGHHALGRIAFVVPAHQLQLATAQEPALGVDLVDGDAHAAGQGFAGLGRLAREGRDQADLDGIGGQCQRRQCGGNSRCGDGDQGTTSETDHLTSLQVGGTHFAGSCP